MTENEVVDHNARDTAKEAYQRISSHEELCAERYKNILAKLTDNRLSIDVLYKRFWMVSCSLISFLVLVIFLLIKLLVKI